MTDEHKFVKMETRVSSGRKEYRPECTLAHEFEWFAGKDEAWEACADHFMPEINGFVERSCREPS